MKTTTSIKIDKETKEAATKLAGSLGLSLSSVINASLKKFVRDRYISFGVEPELNAASKKKLRTALSEIQNTDELVGPFSTIRDLKKSLSK